MAKLKNPLLSLKAQGGLAKALTFLRRRHQDIVESTPIPEDAKSLAQLSWRHMYQKCTALWHALSAAEKQDWESSARRKHMTGYAWFISQCLRPNPGIYLPLQGGTMSGDIDMAKHRILKLPAPVDNQEPARKIDIGVGTFLGLTDTPGAYAGQALKFTRVNAAQNALEFAFLTFLALTDTPASYAGQALKFLRVNAATNALEFTAAVAADYPMKLKPALTRWVVPGWYSQSYSDTAFTAGRIYYIPIFVEETTTFIRIGLEVAALSAGTADLRIFNWSGGLPNSLVLSAGTVNTGTTGLKEIVISEQLTRGYYFLAIRCTGTPQIRCFRVVTWTVYGPVAALAATHRVYPDRVVLTIDAAYADPAPAPDDAASCEFIGVQLREN